MSDIFGLKIGIEGENDRAEYGKNLLKLLSERLTAEFGKGFDVRNLRNMRHLPFFVFKRFKCRNIVNIENK